MIGYYEKPDSLKCGKLVMISAKVGTTDCSAIENVVSPVLTIYIKSDKNNADKCIIETNPKIEARGGNY